jgi:hypothetical protein
MSPLPQRGKYLLATDWDFDVDGRAFQVPTGYQWDGASVPRFFHRVVTPFAPAVITAALEHDWLCDTQPADVPYRRAAAHFRDRLHVGAFRKQLMYRAVLHFGPRW